MFLDRLAEIGRDRAGRHVPAARPDAGPPAGRHPLDARGGSGPDRHARQRRAPQAFVNRTAPREGRSPRSSGPCSWAAPAVRPADTAVVLSGLTATPGQVRFLLTARDLPPGTAVDPAAVAVSIDGTTAAGQGAPATDTTGLPPRLLIVVVDASASTSSRVPGRGQGRRDRRWPASLPADVQLGLYGTGTAATAGSRPPTGRRVHRGRGRTRLRRQRRSRQRGRGGPPGDWPRSRAATAGCCCSPTGARCSPGRATRRSAAPSPRPASGSTSWPGRRAAPAWRR